MQFLYPEYFEDYEYADWPTIKQTINKDLAQNGLKIKFRFLLRSKHLYVRCTKCTSNMKFAYDESTQMLHLITFENRHKHTIQNRKQKQIEQVKQFIIDLPKAISTNSAKNLVLQKFSISPSRFYYFYNKIKNPMPSIEQLFHQLENLDCDMFTDPYERQMNSEPKLFILSSPLMKENFKRFGHWCTFDFTYGIIASQDINYKVGCFAGLSFSKRIVPFGLVISQFQTKEVYKQIFQSFFTIMSGQPKVFITDESTAIKGALGQMKEMQTFSGCHLLDSFHILKNIKKNLKNKESFKHFVNLINFKTEAQFQEYQKTAYQEIQEEDMGKFTKFIENSRFYCFSQVPRQLVGFSISDSYLEKLNDLIKQQIPERKSYTVAVLKIFKLLQGLSVKCFDYSIERNKIQEFVGIGQLKQLRCLLDKRVFAELIKEVKKVFSYHLKELSDFQILVGQPKSQCKLWYDYSLGKYHCSCKIPQKTGLPCSHLFKVKAHFKLKLLSYVHQRWFIMPKPQIMIQENRGRNKITRRKRHY